MSSFRPLFLTTVIFLAAAGPLLAAPDVAELRAQLALATTDDATLSRIELLRRILDAEPGDTASHRLLIELWCEVGDYDLAAATLDAWPDAPPDLTALTRAKISRFRDKDVPAAIAILRAHLATSPRDIPAHEALVGALLATNDAAAQVAALDALIPLQGTAANLIERARAKSLTGDYPGAIADARAAQSLEPSSDVVKNNLPVFERLEETLAQLPALDAALATNPRDVPKLIARAWWFRYAALNDRALGDATTALAVVPDSLAAKISRDRSQWLLGTLKSEAALRDDLVDVTKAHALETIIAIADADLILAKNSRAESSLRARARALNDAGQFRLAQRDAEAALALAPKDSLAALEALSAAAQLGEDPAPLYRRMEEMKPPRSQLALATARIADQYFRQSKFPLALDFADRSLAQAETAEVLRLKAATLQRLGRLDEAAAATKRANSLRP